MVNLFAVLNLTHFSINQILGEDLSPERDGTIMKYQITSIIIYNYHFFPLRSIIVEGDKYK